MRDIIRANVVGGNVRTIIIVCFNLIFELTNKCVSLACRVILCYNNYVKFDGGLQRRSYCSALSQKN